MVVPEYLIIIHVDDDEIRVTIMTLVPPVTLCRRSTIILLKQIWVRILYTVSS